MSIDVSDHERCGLCGSEKDAEGWCASYCMDGDEEPVPCPQCGGDGGILGVLGNTTHYSCRQCGWEWSAL